VEKLTTIKKLTSSMKIKEKIATLTFIIFLVGIFFYSLNTPIKENHDLYQLADQTSHSKKTPGTLFIYDGVTVHSYPLLGKIPFKLIPVNFFIYFSPFALVSIYLLIYFIVSKKIIYYYPLSILTPLFFSTFTASTIDWILLPVVYDRIRKNQQWQAIFLGVLMIYLHGVIPLFYLTVLYIYLKKPKELSYIVAFSIPQLIPLIYYSPDYYEKWSGILYFYRIYWISFKTSMFHFRLLMSGLYMVTFIGVIKGNKK
jgi:hypothetical protein